MDRLTRRASRRSFVGTTLAGAAALLAACSSAAPATPAPSAAAKPAASGPAPTAPVQIAVPTPAGAATTAPAATKPAAAATVPSAAAPAATKPAAAVTVPSAAATAPAEGTPKRGGILRMHRQNDWSTFDPHMAQTNITEGPLVFEYLTKIVRNAAGGFEVRGALAESWETPEPTTVVFKLAKGVKFHDGTDFDAAAAKWNIDRMLTHPKSTAKTYLGTVQSAEVVDPSTLRLKLKGPSPSLFFTLSSDADSIPAMLSPTHVRKVGDEAAAKSPVATGPFKFVEWKPGTYTKFARFDGYWKKGADGKPLPYPDEAQMNLMQDWSAALVSLRSNNLDLMNGIAGKDVPTVKADPNLVYREAPWQATTYALCFNARPGAKFADPKMKPVRQAVFYAIDRAGMAKALGLGLGEPTSYHLVPGQLGFSEKVPAFGFEPDRSKKLLADAGFASGVDITLDYISRPEDQQNVQLYKQFLEAVGIRLTLQPQERVAWVQKMQSGNFEFGAFLSGTRPDADLVIGYRFAKGGPGNYAGYVNPEVDKALDEGRTTYDLAKRQAAYEKAQGLVFDDAFYTFTWRRNGNFVYQKTLKGWQDPWGGPIQNQTELWLDR